MSVFKISNGYFCWFCQLYCVVYFCFTQRYRDCTAYSLITIQQYFHNLKHWNSDEPRQSRRIDKGPTLFSSLIISLAFNNRLKLRMVRASCSLNETFGRQHSKALKERRICLTMILKLFFDRLNPDFFQNLAI